MQRNELVMIHGQDYTAMAVRLLTAIDLAGLIGDKRRRVALKPNLVIGTTADTGAVTHPEILDGALTYLQQQGFADLRVMEGSWVGSRTAQAVEVSGLAAVCRRHKVPFIDLQKDSSYPVDAKGMPLRLCSEVRSVDFLINLPVFKGHCQTLVTCALKNAKGLLPNSEKRRFHTMGLHKPIAHLNTVLPPQLILVDNICGDLDFEEGGNPVQMGRIFACLDPVLCDAFVCESMGHRIEEVPYIGYAAALGVGCADTSQAHITLLNEPQEPVRAHVSGRVRRLAQYVDAKNACSACYGSLIYALDRLEEEGLTRGKKQKIAIGQGWRGAACPLGVGNCTRGGACSLGGCPPTALEMAQFLRENWR